ncbi:MAG: hypothetical protein M0R48_03905, partial [Candidatus Omnitrophica bacterium]|nr:hypothetical protein [Candidatus Omnitrophota bacterium]
MDESSNQQYSGIFNETQKERAKPFIRTIALFLVFCMLYQDAISGAGSDYASTLKSSYQKPITLPKKNVLLSLLSGVNSLVFGGSAYAQEKKKDPPPKQQSYSSPKPSPSPATTQPQAANPSAAVSAGSLLTKAGQALGIQRAEGNVPKGALVNFQITNQGWQNISTATKALGLNTISTLTSAVAATGAATTVKSNGNWNVQMTGAGSSITGLNQQGFGNVAGAFWNSHITNSSQTGALNGLFASNGSTIGGTHQYGLGNYARADNFSNINGLKQSGAFNYAQASNGSSLTNVRQYGVGNFTAANNFSHYRNINQSGAFNVISNNATRMNNINQYGLGNSISGNKGSTFTNINQYGALNKINNNLLSSFNNINQRGVANSMS